MAHIQHSPDDPVRGSDQGSAFSPQVPTTAPLPTTAPVDVNVYVPEREGDALSAAPGRDREAAAERAAGMLEADLGLHKISDYERRVQEQEMRERRAVEEAVADADKKQFNDLEDVLSEDAEGSDEDGEEHKDFQDEDGNELPLQPRTCWSRFTKRAAFLMGSIIPAGGLLASAMNIAGSTIGGGILGLPSGANQTGLVLAYIYVLLMILFNVMSMRMLGITAQKTGIRSFEAMARYLFPQGNYAFSYWIAFIRWFNSMGSCIAYVISVGNCFKPIFTGAHEKYPNNAGYKYFMTGSGLKVMTVIVFFCIMVPLILPRHVDSLRYAASLAIALMLYFCVIVVVHSCIYGLKEHRHNVTLSGHFGRGEEDGVVFLFRTGNPVVEALGTFLFAFVCQVNAVEVYWDMAKHLRNPNGYTAAAALAISICAIIYIFVFTFGYFDFGAKKLGKNSILLMYSPMKEPEVMLAYVGVLIKLCVAYALQAMSARNAVYYAIGFTERYAKKKDKTLVVHGRDHHHDGAGAAHQAKDLTRGGSSGDHHRKKNKLNKKQKCARPDSFSELSDGGEASLQAQELSRPYEGGNSHAHQVKAMTSVDAPSPCLTMDQSYIDNIPIQWHLLVVGILAAICLLLGLFIPAINVVFDFAGSICGSFLEFIAPALFVMYSGDFTIKKAGLFMWVMAHLSLIVGVIALVFGTGATIYGLAGGK